LNMLDLRHLKMFDSLCQKKLTKQEKNWMLGLKYQVFNLRY
jgi:hypothetical protein